MNIFVMLLSFIVTVIITYFNKDIFFTINFALIILLYISLLMFFKSFMTYFSFEALDKVNLLINNRKIRDHFRDALNKNRELIHIYNRFRKDFILLTLKNAHLTLLVSSFSKNKQIFDNTLKELEIMGVTSDIINKFGNLVNLINLIEAKKVEIIIQENNKKKKILFKEIQEETLEKTKKSS